MVFIAPLVGAAFFLSGLTAAAPARRGYSSGSSSESNSNSYNSGDSSSNYGSSNSNNYGGNSNNYGNSYDTTSSSSMMMETSSTMMMEETSSTMNMYETSSTMMMESSSSTMEIDSTSTTTSYNSYQTSTYGSGSSYWGGSGYQDCVNQCIATYGGMSGGGSYQATTTSGSYGSKGTGATHTVIVAPTQGVLRMMPFATNASVGDTIEFHWGANNHTVTKSSELLPCNKSAAAPIFASGVHDANFVFTQVVNDTNPTFYYCGTPGHCEKGMFGIINPKMAAPGAPTSMGGMMSSMASNDSDLAAYAAYSMNATAGNNAASTWGSNFDMESIPGWAQPLMATNVLFTRATFGMNPDTLNADGSSNLANVATTPLMIPMDISGALNAASASTGATTGNGAVVANPAGDAATTAAPTTATSTDKPSSAVGLASSKMLVGAAVVLATIFAL